MSRHTRERQQIPEQPPVPSTLRQRIAFLDGRRVLLPDATMNGSTFIMALREVTGLPLTRPLVVVTKGGWLTYVTDGVRIPSSMPEQGCLDCQAPLMVFTLETNG